MNDTLYTIKRSARHFFSGTLLSRASGMMRDMSMAYAFGTQPAVAALFMAYRFAHLLRRVLGEGAMQSAFIPTFEALRHQDESRALNFFRDLVASVAIFLVILVVICSAILAGILSWGNLDPDNQEVFFLGLIMSPSLIFICLFGLNTSLLQCKRKYFTASASSVAFNGIWIFAVFLVQSLPVQEAMLWVAVSVVIGSLVQWIITTPQTFSLIRKASLSSFQIRSLYLSSDLRLFFKPLILGIIGISASQINNLVDSLFAWYANTEGPAILWYAIRVQQLPLALFAIAIAGAVLPPMSRALKANCRKDYESFLQYALYRTWCFMVPITALLLVTGDLSIQLIYGRGDFGIYSVIKTTYCLWAYAIGLLPTALILILAPASYAKENYKVPMLASILALTLNTILNSLFIFGLGLGAVSVAIATSISAWINFFFLSGYLYRDGITLVTKDLIKDAFKVTLVSGLACLGTYTVRIQFLPFFDAALLSYSIFEQVGLLLIQGGIFAGIGLIGILLYPSKSKIRV